MLNICGFFLRLVPLEGNRHGFVNIENKFRVLLPWPQHGVISVQGDWTKRHLAFLPSMKKVRKSW